jgi:hypothetical protein
MLQKEEPLYEVTRQWRKIELASCWICLAADKKEDEIPVPEQTVADAVLIFSQGGITDDSNAIAKEVIKKYDPERKASREGMTEEIHACMLLAKHESTTLRTISTVMAAAVLAM